MPNTWKQPVCFSLSSFPGVAGPKAIPGRPQGWPCGHKPGLPAFTLSVPGEHARSALLPAGTQPFCMAPLGCLARRSFFRVELSMSAKFYHLFQEHFCYVFFQAPETARHCVFRRYLTLRLLWLFCGERLTATKFCDHATTLSPRSQAHSATCSKNCKSPLWLLLTELLKL